MLDEIEKIVDAKLSYEEMKRRIKILAARNKMNEDYLWDLLFDYLGIERVVMNGETVYLIPMPTELIVDILINNF